MSKIKVGHTLPDFELPDENGELHRLSELQGDNVMVLMLGRGEHCPRERQHQRELIKLNQWCTVGFASMVTVLPGGLHDVFKLKISTPASRRSRAASSSQKARYGRATAPCSSAPRIRTRSTG